MTSYEQRHRQIRTELVALRLSVVLLLSIGAAEVAYGIALESIALVADGVHSFADSAVSVLVLAGIAISRRKPDRVFSHGYAKAETLFGLLAAVTMISLGALMLYESYLALSDPTPIRDMPLAIAVAASAGAASLALAFYKLQLAKRSSSLALRIEAYNSIKDGSASIVVVVGVWMASLGYAYFDAVAGVIISIMIIAVGYVSVKESSVVLLDGCLCPERLERIYSIAMQTRGVAGMSGVRLRRVGRSVAGQAVVRVDGSLSVSDAHEVLSELKRRIISEYRDISELVLEIEPSEPASRGSPRG